MGRRKLWNGSQGVRDIKVGVLPRVHDIFAKACRGRSKAVQGARKVGWLRAQGGEIQGVVCLRSQLRRPPPPPQLRRGKSPADRYHAGIAVRGDVFTAADTLSRHARPQHRWDVIFARHDGTVTEQAAHVRDDA